MTARISLSRVATATFLVTVFVTLPALARMHRRITAVDRGAGFRFSRSLGVPLERHHVPADTALAAPRPQPLAADTPAQLQTSVPAPSPGLIPRAAAADRAPPTR